MKKEKQFDEKTDEEVNFPWAQVSLVFPVVSSSDRTPLTMERPKINPVRIPPVDRETTNDDSVLASFLLSLDGFLLPAPLSLVCAGS